MDEKLIASGRRAVAWKRWRWAPGMLDQFGDRAVGKERAEYEGGAPFDTNGASIPDFSDPATVGATLDRIAEACGADHAGLSATYVGNAPRWVVTLYYSVYCEDCESSTDRIEALCLAMEAAPLLPGS